jgi:uncharacterized phage protein (TIGR01671 family)
MIHKFKFVFQHKRDKDYQYEMFSINDLLSGRAADMVQCFADDGYLVVGKLPWTGLIDKKKVNIYEGDIVIVTYGKWHEEPKGLTRKGRVVYSEAKAQFVVMINNSAVEVGFYDTKSRDIEIIGDIYENPELLEGGI